MEDPSLIIYRAMAELPGVYLVTNGDQTDTILAHLQSGKSFESALNTRMWEPDPPINTPRISGLINTSTDLSYTYKLGILKTVQGNANYTTRHYHTYETPVPGFGHCITTYLGDGDPVHSFEGEPYTVALMNNLEETANHFWSILNDDNKVALLIKFIDPATNQSDIHIVNRYQS